MITFNDISSLMRFLSLDDCLSLCVGSSVITIVYHRWDEAPDEVLGEVEHRDGVLIFHPLDPSSLSADARTLLASF